MPDRMNRIEEPRGPGAVLPPGLLCAEVVEESLTALGRWNLGHYIQAGDHVTRSRFRRLHAAVIESLRARRLDAILTHVDRIAEERFEDSFSLVELQTAFNVLEEALWRRVLTECDAEEIPDYLGRVSTVLGAGRDRLSRRYVQLIRGNEHRTPQARALFAGTQGGQEVGHV